MVKNYLLPVEVQELENGRYLAICEVIQGCHAEGDTVAEALENLEDVARILLELRKEDGLALPEGLQEQRIAKGGV
ncbi:MAG: type II toxin-antitoxin system HicB family antitoxin, partial [Dehalococcoidia bacterium]